jgi:ferric-dicitrate binding protein FerR (iron transport regulator)
MSVGAGQMARGTQSRLDARLLLAGCAVLLLFTFAKISTCTAQAAAASGAGNISALQGTATVTRGARALPAAYGMALAVGDRIATGSHGRVTVNLRDGTQLELAESSALVISEEQVDANGNRLATRLDLLGGLVHSLVRFAPGVAPNYEVHTPNAVAAARGTTYDTDYITGTERKGFQLCREFTDVAVFDGRVEVSNPTNKTAGSVEVQQGHRTTVPCGLAPLTAIAASSAATGSSAATIVGGTMLGGSLAGAAVVGGVGAAGGLGGNSSPAPSPSPMTPSQ